MYDRWPVGDGSRVDLVQREYRRHWDNEGTFPRISQAKDTRDVFHVENSLVFVYTERLRVY